MSDSLPVSITLAIGKTSSRLGVPVVVIRGVEFGPGDRVPASLSGLEFTLTADELLGVWVAKFMLSNPVTARRVKRVKGGGKALPDS